MSTSEQTPGRDERVDEVIADYLDALAAGRKPDREGILARHPELSDELRAFFGDQDRLAEAARAFFAPGAGAEASPEPVTLAVGEGKPLGSAPVKVRYFGDYELLEEISRGGMGVIYRSRQVSLNRLVALKMILAGQFASPEDVQRFRTEAEAAANLDHPNIVPIYEVGEHEGQHYFSMKLIEGGSLSPRISAFVRDPKGAARLMATVARAVHFAHQRGILHRDLKPGNVLIDTDGQPHVTDFGLAKRMATAGSPLTADRLTVSGAIVGTPAYMAPEQAAARKDLTTGADVYSLGAILYELLTGQPPFQAATPLDTVLQVLEKEPVAPHSRDPKIDRDLETVCLKCLRKEPSRRFDSALALAEDLERWLRGEPIHARPVTRLERARKWVARNPVVAALSGVAVLLLMIGSIVSTWFGMAANQRAHEALEQKGRADDNARAAQQRLARNCVLNGNRLLEAQDWAGALVWYVEALKLDADEPQRADMHRRRVGITLRRFTPLSQLWRLPEGERFGTWNGEHLISIDAGGAVHIRNARTGEPLSGALRLDAPSRMTALSGDGRRVVTITTGDAERNPKQPASARLWEVPGGRPVGPGIAIPHTVRSISLAPDGRQVGFLLETDAKRDGYPVFEFACWSERAGKLARPALVTVGDNWYGYFAHCFSADGNKLLFEEGRGSGGYGFVREAVLRVYDTTTWKVVAGPIKGGVFGQMLKGGIMHRGPHSTEQVPGTPSSLFVRGGEQLVTPPTPADSEPCIWELEAGEKKAAMLTLPGRGIADLAVSSDGTRVAVTGDGIHSWRLEQQNWVRSDQRTGEGEDNLTFSPDGALVATRAGKNGEIVRLRIVGEEQTTFPALHHPETVVAFHFTSEGRHLLTLDRTGVIRTWELSSGAPASVVQASDMGHLELSGDRSRFLSWRGGSLQVHDTRTGKPVSGLLDHGSLLRSAALDPDGTRTLSVGQDGSVRYWDLAKGTSRQVENDLRGEVQASFCEVGRRFLVSNLRTRNWRIRVYDANGEPGGPWLTGREGKIRWMSTPDGRWALASGKGNELPRVQDMLSGEAVPLEPLVGNLDLESSWSVGQPISSTRLVGFDPDWLSLHAWDLASGRRLWSVPDRGPGDRSNPFPGENNLFAVSPDGKHVALDRGHVVWLLDGDTGERIAEIRVPVRATMTFTSDNRFLLVTDWSRGTRVWHAASGQPLGPWMATDRPDRDRQPALLHCDPPILLDHVGLWDAQTGDPLSPPDQFPTKTDRIAGFAAGGASVVATHEREALLRSDLFSHDLLTTPHLSRVVDIVHHDISPDLRPAEELQTLVELFAARRIDAVGTLTDLSEDELFARWKQVGPPREDRARIRFWHETQADYGNPAFHLDRLLEHEPNNAEWHFRRANCPGDRVPVEDRYGEAVALGMDRVSLWVSLGFIHLESKEWPKAEADFSHAVALFPDDGNLWHLRGIVRAEAGGWADAAADFERAYRQVGTRSEVAGGLHWYEGASASLAAGDVAAYRQKCAMELDRTTKDGNKLDSSLLRACCIIPAAVADYSRLLEWAAGQARESKGPAARYEYGMVLYRAGKFAEAARELEEAAKLQMDPAVDPVGVLFLALSRQRGSDQRGARRLLHTTQKWLTAFEAQEPSLQRSDLPAEEPPWLRRLRINLLLPEATP
jgi:WD40 repeat protein/tetratricopeptide (TPR) repeat protein